MSSKKPDLQYFSLLYVVLLALVGLLVGFST